MSTNVKAPANDMQVGDTVATTSKALNENKGATVRRITTSPDGRVQLRGADDKMIRSCEPTTELWRAPREGETTNEEDPAVTTEAPTKPAKRANGAKPAKPAAVAFEWPKPPTELLKEYVTANISTEADAPNRGLPFITSGGTLRIRAEHWRNWLAEQKVEVPKVEAGKPIRELGFSMKPYSLPGQDGSHGFYTGDAPKWASKLPRREVARAAGRPARPFGKLSDEQRTVLRHALSTSADTGVENGAAIRDELLAALETES